MKSIRLAVAIALIAVVAGGYAASQIIYLKGPDSVSDFESKMNEPRVHVLMLLLVVAAIVLGFIPDREDRVR